MTNMALDISYVIKAWEYCSMIPLDYYWDLIKCKFLCIIIICVYAVLVLPYSSLQYINRDLSEEFYTVDNYSDALYKKVCCMIAKSKLVMSHVYNFIGHPIEILQQLYE